MEKVEDRLTVLKDYMTLSDMKNYFQFKDNKTFSEWEQKGLKAVILTEKSKLYKKEDIIEFLDSRRA
ncbi:hypothetical protein [uncultured Anaerococcus sp.]|uniref:hypothetical protein n=1 Tax=uncultured Anaerococcus sp. TaxID=293428 RepID=UPI00288984FA|nr:hypothetical protein [uncultured Anaerococcus sp.]